MTQFILAAIAILALIAVLLYAEYLKWQRKVAQSEIAPEPSPKDAPANRLESPIAREAQAVADWLSAVAFEQTGCVISEHRSAHRRIREAAHNALRELETQPEALVSLPELVSDASGVYALEVRLTRDVIDLLVQS